MDALQVVEVGELDDHLAAILAHLDPDAGVESLTELILGESLGPGSRVHVRMCDGEPELSVGEKSESAAETVQERVLRDARWGPGQGNVRGRKTGFGHSNGVGHLLER